MGVSQGVLPPPPVPAAPLAEKKSKNNEKNEKNDGTLVKNTVAQDKKEKKKKKKKKKKTGTVRGTGEERVQEYRTGTRAAKRKAIEKIHDTFVGQCPQRRRVSGSVVVPNPVPEASLRPAPNVTSTSTMFDKGETKMVPRNRKLAAQRSVRSSSRRAPVERVEDDDEKEDEKGNEQVLLTQCLAKQEKEVHALLTDLEEHRRKAWQVEQEMWVSLEELRVHHATERQALRRQQEQSHDRAAKRMKRTGPK